MIRSIASRVKSSQLAQNTLWMLMGQGLGIFVQALYFILIARSLRSQGYGAFIGVHALVGIIAPFVGIGGGNLLIKNVSRNEATFSKYFGKALLMVLVTGIVILCTVLCLSRIVLPASIPFLLVLIVAVTDLLFSPILYISGQAFQAFQRLERTALIQFLPNGFRLIAIAGLSMFVQPPTVIQWGYLYFITMAVSTLIGISLVRKELGAPVFTLAGMKTEIMEGLYFSIYQSARGVNNDIDKTMLARFSTLEATGIYGAAYRIISVSFTPIISLLYAAYARFFQHGAAGIRGSIGFAKKLFPIAGIYGVAVGILLVAVSPYLPNILGSEYENTANALRWLAPLPFLKAVQLFTADTLTGAGYQGVRSGIQVIAAVFNIAINLWLIPMYSWRGAAWASLLSDGLLSVLLCFAVLYISKRADKAVIVEHARAS